MKGDPPRLLEGPPQDPGRTLLEAGREDLPDARRLASLAARLPIGGAGGGTGTGSGAPLKPPVAAPSTLSGAVIGAVLGLAVLGGSWLVSPGEAPNVDPAAPPLKVSTPVSSPRGNIEPNRAPVAVVPSAVLEPAPSPPSLEAHASGPAPSAPPSAPSAAVLGAGAAPPADLESEGDLLQRAQNALASDPGRALTLADKHATRFPKGSLGQEREMIALSALLALGRRADARTRALGLLATTPSSAYRRRIGVLIPDLEIDARDHREELAPPSTR